MTTLNFSELDSNLKRAVFWLADEAGTLTSIILPAVTHVGELWEAKAFLKHFPRGTVEHEQLVSRLRLEAATTEGILDCIKRVAPSYTMLGEDCTDELLDVLLAPENATMEL